MDWLALRDEFPVTRRWAFFDHAAVAPLPAPTARKFREYADDFAIHGVTAASRWGARIDSARQLAGQILNADPLDVAFIPNTSTGVALVAEGFPWKSGDNVVVPAEEYPANQYPWLNLAHRGVEVRRIPSGGNRIEIDDLRNAMDARTRILAISSVEFGSGFRNDLDALGQLCRDRGIYLFVDAIQSLGAFPFDVQKTPIDFLSADSHKWLLGPEGAGLYWCRREHLNVLHPVTVGWRSVVDEFEFSKIDFQLKPNATRWENGAMNVAGVAAFGASMALLLKIGIETVSERILDLTDHLCRRAERAGIQVFSSRKPNEKSGIVSLEMPGVDLKALVAQCREAGIVVNRRAGRLRVSPHCYNTPEELDRLMDAIAKFVSSGGRS